MSAWACRLQHKACYALSHQCAVINKNAPYPKKTDLIGNWILKNYAPASSQYGFHFLPYDENIFTPIIRREIREAKLTNEGHYTVYLPAYSDKKLLKVLGKINNAKWQVFSKHTKTAYTTDNIMIFPVCNSSFIKSMVSSTGVICGAGFETPAEALFLRKKLMAIPMKGQFEQQCNAEALKEMNVPILKKLSLKRLKEIEKWMESDIAMQVDFPDCTEQVIAKLFNDYFGSVNKKLDKEINLAINQPSIMSLPLKANCSNKMKIKPLKQTRSFRFKNTPIQNQTN